MSSVLETIESAISDVERARVRVRRSKSPQIRIIDEIDYFKSVAYSWFKTHRSQIEGQVAEAAVEAVDDEFQTIMDATAKSSARGTYSDAFKRAKDALVDLRASTLALPSKPQGTTPIPVFSSLAADAEMQAILSRRWKECELFLQAGAYLAATVMMGGLLEALFVARANQMTDKRPLFTAKSTPIDGRTKKPLQLGEWTLRPYLDVGAELGWISKPGKDVGAVLRDYRNYVHPEKERVHGMALNSHDAAMFWEMTKSLARQLLGS
jgi:hypothetical protein